MLLWRRILRRVALVAVGRRTLSAFVLTAVLSVAQSITAPEQSFLRGTVHDGDGNPVSDATIQLRCQSLAQTSHTSTQGFYEFSQLGEGVYSLAITKTGYADAGVSAIVLARGEVKNIDLVLHSSSRSASAALTAAGESRFYDEPQFTVSGVTDTTSLGGHGSDTVARTRDSLAKETVSLNRQAPNLSAASFAATVKALRAALEKEPLSFEANRRLGRLLLENNQAREAIPYLERAAQVNSADYDNAYTLALAQQRAGDYEQARAKARSLLLRHDTAELHHLLADVQESLGNPLDAVRQYQRAAEMTPSEMYLFDWGAELLLHHAPDPAAEVFSKGNSLFPRSSRMLIGLGATSFARGANEQAVSRICAAADLDARDPAAYLFLGEMLRADLNPSADVLERLHRFVVLQPENAEAHYYYALALWKGRGLKPHDEASRVESLLDRAIHLNPNFAVAHLQLGIVRDELGNTASAITYYQRAIASDPRLEEAHYRLGQVYRKIGESEKATKEFRIHGELAKEAAQRSDNERREIRQFVYTLRDKPDLKTP